MSIYLTSQGVVSPSGTTVGSHWDLLRAGFTQNPCYQFSQYEQFLTKCGKFDASIGMASEAVKSCLRGLIDVDLDTLGVIYGSSRGAARGLESLIFRDLRHEKLPAWGSPVTTGSAALSFLLSKYGIRGFSTSISNACATGLFGVILASNLIRSGQLDASIVCCSEASDTDFIRKLLGRAGVLSKRFSEEGERCLPFHSDRDGMFLSEGGAAICLEGSFGEGRALAKISGWGVYHDPVSLAGVDKSGIGVAKVVQMALDNANLNSNDIDVVVAHGAGTILGDLAESRGLGIVFGDEWPTVCCHKWAFGHQLSVGSLLSLSLSVQYLQENECEGLPYVSDLIPNSPKKRRSLRRILNFAMGFGGHLAAVIIEKI